MICGHKEGTIFQNEWPSYGISEGAERRLLAALSDAERDWKLEDAMNISPTPVETQDQLSVRTAQPSQEEREKLEAAYYLNVVWPAICGGES